MINYYIFTFAYLYSVLLNFRIISIVQVNKFQYFFINTAGIFQGGLFPGTIANAVAMADTLDNVYVNY